MRILYLHQHYNFEDESGSTRSHHIASELGKRGHEVLVICSGKIAVERNLEKYKVIRIEVDYRNSMSFYQRSLAFQLYNRKVYQTLKSMQSFDLCIATSTPLNVGFLAMKLKKKLEVPFIFEVRDLWPKAPVDMGFIRQRWLSNWLYKMEMKIYKDADFVVALSPPQQKNIKARFPNLTVEMVPNFSHSSAFQSRAGMREGMLKRWREGGFKMIYFGAIGVTNDLKQIRALAAKMLNTKLPIQIDIFGDGSEKEMLAAAIIDEGLKNIRFHDAVPKKDIPQLLSNYDFSYISFAQYDVLRTNSPNKFFDSMAAGLYCICNIKSWFGDLAESGEFGHYAIPGKEDSAIEKLRELISEPHKLLISSARAQELSKDLYSSEVQSKRMADLIEKQRGLTE